MKSNSWIIIDKETKLPVMETWDYDKLKYLKPKFKSVPTHIWLYWMNRMARKENK
jgi:hypothetical protein